MASRSGIDWDAVKSGASPEEAEPTRPSIDWEAVKSDTDPDYKPQPVAGTIEPIPQQSGAEQFLQQAAGAIMTPIAKGLDVVGEAFGGDSQIEELLRAGGTIPAGPPTTAAGRIGKTGTELGALGLGVGLLVPKIAASLLPALSSVEAGGPITALLQRVLGAGPGAAVADIVPKAARAVGTSPTAKALTTPMALGMEARAAAGGGYGGAASGEAARAAGYPEYAPQAEMLGGIPGALGAVVGPQAMVRAIQGGAAHARRRMPGLEQTEGGKRFYQEQATEAAAAKLRQSQNLPEENVRRIQAARDVQEQLPGTEFSTAQATDDLAYRTMVSDTTKRDPAYSGRIQRMQERTQAALKTEMEGAAPAGGGAEDLVARVQTGVGKHMADLDAKLAEVSAQVDARLQTVRDKSQYSSEFASGVNEGLMPWFKGKVDELYAPLRALGYQFQLPMSKIQKAVQLSAEDISPAELKQMGTTPKSIQSVIEAPDVQPFAHIEGMRRAMNADLDIYRPGGRSENPVAYRMVKQAKQALDDSLDGLQASGDVITEGVSAQEVKEMWGVATEFFRKGAKVTREGLVGQITGKGKGALIAPEDAAKKLAAPGLKYQTRVKELDDLTTYMRGEGLAQEADGIDAAIQGYLAKDSYDALGVGVTGKKLKANDLEKWRKNNKEMLDHYPELDAHLKDVESAQRLFEAEGVTHNTSVDVHTKSLAGTFLKKDVGEAINTVLAHPNPKKAAGELLLKAGDSPEAKQGMLRSIYDHMMDRAYKDVIDEGLYAQAGGAPSIEVLNPKRIAEVASRKKYEPLIEMLGGTKHLERWREIMRAARRAERTGIAPATRMDPEDTVSRPLIDRRTASRVGRSIYGQFRDPFAKVDTGMRWVADHLFETFPDEMANTILKKALAEPDFAEQLLKRDTPEMRAAIAKMLAPDVNIAPVAAVVTGDAISQVPESIEGQP